VGHRNTRLRVLLLTAEYPPYVWGGLGRYSHEAVKALRQFARVDVINIPSYYRTMVVGESPASHPFHEDEDGFVIHAIFDESLDVFRTHTHDLRRAVDATFRRLSCEVLPHLAPRYDFIYAQDYYTAPFAVRLHLNGVGNKLAVMCHLPVYAGFTYFDKPHADEVHQALEAAGVRLADIVIVPSEFAKRVLIMTHAVHPDRIRVIREGVVSGTRRDRDIEPAETNDVTRILSVGRLVEQKGWHYTVDSLSALRRLDVPFTFSLVGCGPQEGKVRSLFHAVGLEGAYEHTRRLDHSTVLSMYRECHIFLSTALYETFGLTVLEAMSGGCVPVTFELPPLVELIGGAGITVPVGDTDARAKSIASLATNPSHRARLARECERRATPLTWDAHARALVTLMAESA
jgi:glycosyltransferase involved in cell wall biosynthesis